jgi:hypothetical protein
MSRAGGGSTTSELGESSGPNAAKPVGRWRESVPVFVMVLLPVSTGVDLSCLGRVRHGRLAL